MTQEPPVYEVIAARDHTPGWWELNIDTGTQVLRTCLAFAPTHEEVESCTRSYIAGMLDCHRDSFGLSMRWVG